MSLPYVVDAQTSLSPAELQVLQEQYESEASSGHITTQTKFNYAWALVKSQSRQQMLQGVTLLTGMWLGRGAGAGGGGGGGGGGGPPPPRASRGPSG